MEEPEASESPDPIANKDAPTPVPVPEVAPPLPSLESLDDLQSKCLGPKTHTCLLTLLPPKSDPEAELPQRVTAALADLAELAQKHKARGDHLFPFYVVPASNTGSEVLATRLELDKTEDVSIIAVNGKRSWYRVYDHTTNGLSASAVEGWVDGIRLGEGKKSRLPDDLFPAATSDAKSDAESTQASERATETATSEKETLTIIHGEL